MSHATLLLSILIIGIFAALPTWPHSSAWGYTPSALMGMLLIMALALVRMGGL
jgi:hypothetical protein